MTHEEILYKLEFLVEIGWKITIIKGLDLNKNMLEDCSIDNTNTDIIKGCENYRDGFSDDFSDIESLIDNLFNDWNDERYETDTNWDNWEEETKLRRRWGFNQFEIFYNEPF